MGTDEIPHINNVNDTLKLVLEELRLLNQTMSDISSQLDKISDDTSRIP